MQIYALHREAAISAKIVKCIYSERQTITARCQAHTCHANNILCRISFIVRVQFPSSQALFPDYQCEEVLRTTLCGTFAYLSSSHLAIRWFPIRKHLPQCDTITPDITGMRECTIVDGLWSIPDNKKERKRGRENGGRHEEENEKLSF